MSDFYRRQLLWKAKVDENVQKERNEMKKERLEEEEKFKRSKQKKKSNSANPIFDFLLETRSSKKPVVKAPESPSAPIRKRIAPVHNAGGSYSSSLRQSRIQNELENSYSNDERRFLVETALSKSTITVSKPKRKPHHLIDSRINSRIDSLEEPIRAPPEMVESNEVVSVESPSLEVLMKSSASAGAQLQQPMMTPMSVASPAAPRSSRLSLQDLAIRPHTTKATQQRRQRHSTNAPAYKSNFQHQQRQRPATTLSESKPNKNVKHFGQYSPPKKPSPQKLTPRETANNNVNSTPSASGSISHINSKIGGSTAAANLHTDSHMTNGPPIKSRHSLTDSMLSCEALQDDCYQCLKCINGLNAEMKKCVKKIECLQKDNKVLRDRIRFAGHEEAAVTYLSKSVSTAEEPKLDEIQSNEDLNNSLQQVFLSTTAVYQQAERLESINQALRKFIAERPWQERR
eukprot:TRINITY_DN12_c0_g1_i1.p1 TRINITY_DN12_c0_g1~~TRINITY_DN12_c0_g1_i1.p1  ORF type:complete len:459 (+),score=143.83 TRINITY_DN12_c0_g1_i1:34-1410(+)